MPRKKTAKQRKGKAKPHALSRGKRKRAIARAVVTEGNGKVTINKMNIEAISNEYLKAMLKEPLGLFGEKANKVNVSINVKGGGIMGQLQAARRALVVGIAKFLGDNKLLDSIKKEDRYLVVEDPRRVEPKKYKGRKARARFQKSYR